MICTVAKDEQCFPSDREGYFIIKVFEMLTLNSIGEVYELREV